MDLLWTGGRRARPGERGDADEGGNIWVAGGTEGLFLLEPGETRFKKFGLADGLHPYGYLAGGAPATTAPYLEVLSVAGGPPGTVFVGYHGKWGPPTDPTPERSCEVAWDGSGGNADLYKSGDADKVTLHGTNLSVVHYDIFSGKGIVPNEPNGREKICTVYSIRYDAANHSVWFGANHGFAWGDANFRGDPSCGGELDCSGLWEHSHPRFNGYGSDTSNDCCVLYGTDDFRGIAVDPNTHDVWFGGLDRSTLFKYGSNGGGQGALWAAQALTESDTSSSDRLDLWPDRVTEPAYPRPADLVRDSVFAMAAMPDGTVWVGSGSYGLAHVGTSGQVLGYLKNELLAPNVSSVARDPSNDSLWVGYRYGNGLDRLQNGQVLHYDFHVLGPDLSQSAISDIQMANGPSPQGRRVLVGFQKGPKVPAGIGIYSGQ